jgi:hypothetical protein
MRTQKPLQFRRESGSNVWHFHVECSRWPKRSYIYSDKPTDGAACKECMILARLKPANG